MSIRGRNLLGLYLAMFYALSNAEEPFSLNLIMEKMAETGGHTVRFVERRELDILVDALVSKGELTFIPPGGLEKRIIEPKLETYIVNKNQLTIVTGDTQKVLQLTDFPGLRAFVEAFRASLAGDIETLRKFYKVDIAGSKEAWELTLTPLQTDMVQYVSFVTIKGAQGLVSQIKTTERNGDITLMELDRDGY